MLRFPLLLFVLATFAVECKAGGSGYLLGKVTIKESSQPLAFAELVLENNYTRHVVSANEYGHYYANRLPGGKYTMSVTFNGKLFQLPKVIVYDGYTIELNVSVSNDTLLPNTTALTKLTHRLSSVETTDITLSNSTNHQPTRSLSEALTNHGNVDIRDGRLYIKGSDQVKFFIDGTPVMGQPIMQRTW